MADNTNELVKLQVKVGSEIRTNSFEIDHASRLLRHANNGGWHLPSGSNFKFSKKDGVTRRSNSSKAGEA